MLPHEREDELPSTLSRVRPRERTPFEQGGEMGALMETIDWAATPLGPVSEWSPALKTTVALLVRNRFPLLLWWGPSFAQIYNDAYRPVPGEKHPRSLGQPAAECWPEIWHVIGPMIEAPFRGEPATWSDDLFLMITRRGFLEETHFKVAYSPVPDESTASGIGGVLATVAEITGEVYCRRQLATLRDLAAQAAEAKTAEQACARAAQTMAGNDRDIPCALFYLLDADGRTLKLAGASGFEAGGAGCAPPPELPADDGVMGWPLGRVMRERRPAVVELGDTRLPSGAWAEPPRRAVLLALSSPDQASAYGVLVVGASPHRELDEGYRSFFTLTAEHVASAIRNARAYQSERERAEKLAEIDRAKTHFFSNVSHEFRTPLTLMLAPIEELRAARARDEGDRERLDLLHRNALRLLKLVNNLLDFSRIEAGRADAAYEPTDLGGLTAELASTFRSAAERAGLRFVVDCAPLAEPAWVDRGMWERIVLNLLSNAFKFTFEGEIAIRVREAEGGTELVVGDTGVGIAGHHQARLFERFYRVEGARSRSHEGSGIGLSLVQELVRMHGGEIGVESVEGRGTTFRVRVPRGSGHLPQDRLRADHALPSTAIGAGAYVEEASRWTAPADEAPPAAAHERAPAPRARVVIADDNADMRAYLSRLLRGHWDVEAAADGEEALQAIRRRRPDLILADVMMPRLDGFGLLRAVRDDEALRGIPFVMLSARAGEEASAEGLGAGADDYLVKPFGARDLLVRVAARLSAASAARELQEQREALRVTTQRLESANRSKDEFLATMSHELRTPLNAVLGWANILRRNPRDEARLLRGLEVIERNARAQERIVSDLLDVSRIVSGKLQLSVRRTHVATVVSAAVDVVRHAAEGRGVRLLVGMDPDVGEIVADADRLQQVVWNLLSNAVRFTPRAGSVAVTAARMDGALRIRVEDTGAGIPREHLPHIFERFRQVDSSTTRAHGGLGLGLAIVRHLVEAHGGHVEAESEGPGRGAAFTVVLPIQAVDTSRAHVEGDTNPGAFPSIAAPESATSLRDVRVLVVDDDTDSLEILRSVLADAGAAVTTAQSAGEALDAPGPFDVIVSDLGMPRMDGYAFMRRVRSSDVAPRTPAIALTAYARPEDAERALRCGFQEHLKKPVEPGKLLAAVRAWAVPRQPRPQADP